jgi:hypothetical protein
VKQLLAIAMLLMCSVGVADAAWERATVYYLPWELETRANLSPERARRLASDSRSARPGSYILHVASAHELAQLLRILDLQHLQSSPRSPEDSRLVIDLEDGAGNKATYHASYFRLCSANDSNKRAIDANFREFFRVAHR